MFDVGFSELVLLAVIGLLVLGPQRLPKIAAEVGRWTGRARRTLAHRQGAPVRGQAQARMSTRH